MASSRAPLALARAATELAVRPLPELDDRLRYRAEFLADLHALTALGQVRYAAGVLSRTFALRAALGEAPTGAEEAAMSLARPRVPIWRCRILRLHDWVTRSTEDGGRYLTCARCGRDRGESLYGPNATGVGGVGGGGDFGGGFG